MAKITGKAGLPSKKQGHKSGTGRDNNIQRIVICVVGGCPKSPFCRFYIGYLMESVRKY